MPVSSLKEVIKQWPDEFRLKGPAQSAAEEFQDDTLPENAYDFFVQNVRHASLVGGN